MLRTSIMKFFVIYLVLSVFEALSVVAQYGFAGSAGLNSGIDGGGSLSESPAGSAGGEVNLEGNLALLGCPPHNGEIDANVDFNASNNNASVKANVTAIAWEKYCKCLKKQLKANAKVDEKGASVNASIPSITCKDPYEEITEEYGYTYTIYPERGATRAIANSGVYLKYSTQKRHDKNDADQEIMYEISINDENPLWIDGTISVNDVPIYSIPRNVAISSCAECEEGTWDCVVIGIWNLGLTENGTCPQDPATFHISQTLPSMTIMFPDKIPCGNYTMSTDAENSAKQWAFHVEWYFTIANDTSCTTESSEES